MHQEHNAVQSPKTDELQADAWSQNLVHDIKINEGKNGTKEYECGCKIVDR